MPVVLATAWHPRGEGARFQRLYPLLDRLYAGMIVSVPPDADMSSVDMLCELPGTQVVITPEWSHGRYLALQEAQALNAGCIHYVDGDRLLRWAETRPDELRVTVDAVTRAEFLVIGRTETAWETHPQALRRTEQISNTLFSRLLGQNLDLSAGSKGFCRDVVTCLMANTSPRRALGTDAEWLVIAHRAGYRVDQILVDGLDWETADRYQGAAVDGERQREAAAQYDEDAAHWAMRVGVAQEIVDAGLDAWERPLVMVGESNGRGCDGRSR